ncbi:MAG: hypothetical protein OXU23_07315 [Candidatus Poribacteria bacterium]|nr:hypothetical protein [Candidatus Poribacteria bacterium]
MYLTVHRVVSRQAERGINGALYKHGTDRRDPVWNPPDLEGITSRNLGTQIMYRADIKPGGNAVECFLDIVFPDDFSELELEKVLSEFRKSIHSARTTLTFGSVTIDFAVNLGESNHIHENFDQLYNAAIELFRNRNLQNILPPLVIIETQDEEYRYFELNSESKRRLRTEFGSNVSTDCVKLPHSVTSDFKELYGELYPFVSEWITDKPRADLSGLGGIRVLHNGQSVWEWIPYNLPRSASTQ